MTLGKAPHHSANDSIYIGLESKVGGRSVTRANAPRGTSRYLGVKAAQLRDSLYRSANAEGAAADNGTTAQPSMLHPMPDPARTRADASDSVTAPRLYYGMESMGEAAEFSPDVVDSNAASVASLEDELRALESRVGYRQSRATPAVVVTPVGPSILQPSPREHKAVGERSREEGRWDRFGRDAMLLKNFEPIAKFLSQRYFRTQVTGIENIPKNGPCLLVANHSGSLPIDGLMLMSALLTAMPNRRPIRFLTEDFVQTIPFVSTWLKRLGAVRASQENALGLLKDGEVVAAFPEGLKGYAKPPAQWYRVQRLGRGGIVHLSLQAKVPILPCAIVGAEEATPSLRRLEAMERLFGLPYFPITPAFPWLGPVGLLPAPTRLSIDIGPAFLTGHETARPEDPLYVANLTETLRTTLQQRLDRLVAKRKSTWFG